MADEELDKKPKSDDVEQAPLISSPAKAVKPETESWLKRNIGRALIIGALLRWFMRVVHIVVDGIILLSGPIKLLGDIIPPIKAMVSGYFFLVEMVEAIFFSKEERERRAFKVFTAITGTGLSIASTILTFNPVTMPLGAALSAGAMAAAALRDFFFWYKTRQDIQVLYQKVLGKKSEIEMAEGVDTSELKKQYVDLQKQLNTAIRLNAERRRSFLYNFFSCVGMVCLAVAAFAAVGAIATNPFTLAVIGLAILGASVVGGIYHLYKKTFYQEARVEPYKSSMTIEEEVSKDEAGLSNEAVLGNKNKYEHVSDTAHVLSDFVEGQTGADVTEENREKVKALAAGQLNHQSEEGAAEDTAAPVAIVVKPPAPTTAPEPHPDDTHGLTRKD